MRNLPFVPFLLTPGLRLSLLVAPLALTPIAVMAQSTTTTTSTPSKATLFPLSAVRLSKSPFSEAAEANRKYLLAHNPDRLLAPFLREAGLESKGEPYPNWESQGLDGHTAGHYLSALADMIAAGHDTDGELNRRLDYMLSELERVQKANGNGYIGGVPGSREFWPLIAAGDTGKIWSKWVPWYNLHKTFAGLRDAYTVANKPKARELLVGLGDWCVNVTSKLNDGQMQGMLNNEYGGMNEVMADIYAITKDKKYLETAERFNHRSFFEPLMHNEDKLTGLHANTQIPKVIGLERIAALTDDKPEDGAAQFFWNTVVQHRTLAFGGNSVSEHFNDPADFSTVLEHREGPETCNTYNMLRLTEQLFENGPKATYADYYERALYNHILSTIDTQNPGYVYFTPIRPDHYRVYSQPEQSFWCCVGTGMENPGRYGQFIYAQDKDGLYVNLFIPSELTTPDGKTLKQENNFPSEPRTRLSLKLKQSSTFALRIRHPWWVREGQLKVRVNGKSVAVASKPSTYAVVRRQWKNGDTIDVDLPMHTSVERLPDGSNWAAVLYGPIVLAAPEGTNDLVGERAGAGRMAHVASGPLVPMDKVPFLLTTADDLPKHIVPDLKAGPLHFRIKNISEPQNSEGLPLEPFYALHHERYQMYWELTSPQGLELRREKLAATEQTKLAYESATLDRVAPGEQQSEVEHEFKNEGSNTGFGEGRRWRGGGRSLQFALDAHGATAATLEVTYWGSDTGRSFDILVDGAKIGTENLNRNKWRKFFQSRYPIPADVLAKANGRRLVVQLVARDGSSVGNIYDLRVLKADAPAAP